MPTPQEYAALERERRRLALPGEPATEPQHSYLDYVKDAAMGVPRGVYDAVQDVYGLGDAITGDALPDWKGPSSLLGESDLWTGMATEAITNFATGFIPVAGALGKAGKIGRTLRLTEEGAETVKFWQRLNPMKTGKGLTFFGDMAAGAVTDFAVFGGHDGRLTDLIKASPGLQDAVEDYVGWMQTHDDDSEVWGRLKNSLEGAGIGGLIGSAHKAFQLYARGKKLQAKPQKNWTAAERREAAKLAKLEQELADELPVEKNSADPRLLMQHEDGRVMLENIAAARDTRGGVTFNQDGTIADLAGTPTNTVTIASIKVPRRYLSNKEVAKYAAKFPSLLGDADVKFGVFRLVQKAEHRADDLFTVDLNFVMPKGSEEAANKFLKWNRQQSYYDNLADDVVVVNPKASGVSRVKTDADAREALKMLRDALEESTELPAGTLDDVAGPAASATDDLIEGVELGTADEFIQKMDEARTRDPAKMWSVDDVSREALEAAEADGRLVKSKGGFAVVMPDGNGIGLFKHTDVPGEKTDDLLVQALLKKGMTKFDNFAAENLMKIYERNGFRVVSSTPFNEAHAPKGWDEAKHGRPDVVAMVYDPEKKLKIEPKRFDSYEEMLAHRDKIMPERDAAYGKTADLPAGTVEDTAGAKQGADEPQPLPEGTVEAKPRKPKGPYVAGLRDLGIDDAKALDIERLVLDHEYMTQVLQLPPNVNPRKLSAVQRLTLGLEHADMNFARNSIDGGVEAQKRVMEQLFRKAMLQDVKTIRPKTMKKMADEAVDQLATIAGLSDKESFAKNMLLEMRKDEQTLAELTARLNANEFWLNKFGDELYFEAAQLRGAGGLRATAEQKVAFLAKYQMFAEAVALVKGSRAERGRLLRSLGSGGGMGRLLADDELMLGAIDAMGGEKKLDAFIEKAAKIADDTTLTRSQRARKLNNLGEATVMRKTLNVVTEYWINAILSAPTTPAISAASGAMYSIFRPFESIYGNLGGALISKGDAVRSAHRRAVRDAAREIYGLITGVTDALSLSKQAFKTGQSTLTPDLHTLDAVQLRDRQAIHSELDSPIGSLINVIGSVVRTPTNVMSGVDEFFRQLTYRAYAKAKLAGDAIDQGLTGPGIERYVNENMDKLAYKGQAYSVEQLEKRGADAARAAGETDPKRIAAAAKKFANDNFDPSYLGPISKQGQSYAKEVTLATPLERGTLAHTVQRAVQTHPLLRFVMPFVRTPMNVIYAATDRVPVGGTIEYVAHSFQKSKGATPALEAAKSRFARDLLSGDARIRGEAYGRVMTGVGVMTVGMSAASAGLITGRGPSDPEQRKILMDAGWLPYAVKTSDGYVSYGRLDPVATMIGICADIYDVGRYSPPEDQSVGEELVNGFLVALANNFTNKSYLVGVANFVEMLQAPDRKADGWARKMSSSFVPNVLKSATTGAGDDLLRDVRNVADAWMAKIPGLADNVRPVRNVLGEPIKKTTAAGSDAISAWLDAVVPFSYRDVSHDGLRKEFERVVTQGGTSLGPPSPKRYGLDLREVKNANGRDAYDRFGELIGLTSIRGRTLRQELESKVGSSRYQSLPYIVDGSGTSPRAAEIQSSVSEYRSAAWRQLVKEFPEIAAREKTYLESKRDLTSGGNSLRNFVASLR